MPPDLYRYFDCTEEAGFLYSCVRRTVESDLPREIDYLRRHEHEFQALRDDEVALIEGVVRDAFDGFEDKPSA